MNILKSGLGQPVESVNTYDHQRGGRFEKAPLLCEISAKGVITGQELSMKQEAPIHKGGVVHFFLDNTP